MKTMTDSLGKLGPTRLAALGAIGIILMLFFGIMMSRMSGGDLKPLYSDLGSEDSNQILTQLDTMGIAYSTADNGATILVGATDVGKARIRISELGLPRGGNIGYELFDAEDNFSTSTFKQQISKVRALEGELARTIMAIETIRNARVHLVLPQRELFSRETQKPTASVFLKIIGSRSLENTQIAAIQHLVASSVPQLKTSNVSIIDDKGNLIARGKIPARNKRP